MLNKYTTIYDKYDLKIDYVFDKQLDALRVVYSEYKGEGIRVHKMIHDELSEYRCGINLYKILPYDFISILIKYSDHSQLLKLYMQRGLLKDVNVGSKRNDILKKLQSYPHYDWIINIYNIIDIIYFCDIKVISIDHLYSIKTTHRMEMILVQIITCLDLDFSLKKYKFSDGFKWGANRKQLNNAIALTVEFYNTLLKQ